MHVPETNTTSNNMNSEALVLELHKRELELADQARAVHDAESIPHLILMVGLPYSGKTTKALEMGHPIVSPNAIRLALHGERYRKESEPMVWAIARTMVAALFLAGHETAIVDACNVSEKRRDEWTDERWSCTHVLVQSSLDECLERAMMNLDQNIVSTIHRMAGNFEWTGWSP